MNNTCETLRLFRLEQESLDFAVYPDVLQGLDVLKIAVLEALSVGFSKQFRHVTARHSLVVAHSCKHLHLFLRSLALLSLGVFNSLV